ncbi:MAG: SUF system NifU family Fe-S cluster assembly protein [Bacillota bacterium]|nr:MAG: SUF system NifU family Fe-S cluster assembly protein [Bacillota bacterium]
MSSDLYREQILDHYRHPRNYGTLEDADISHEDHNPLCGDQVRFEVRLDDGGRVVQAAFTGRGCAISQATASMLTEAVQGKTLDDIKAMDQQTVLGLLGISLSPVRLKCALLPLKVLQAGIYRYESDKAGR